MPGIFLAQHRSHNELYGLEALIGGDLQTGRFNVSAIVHRLVKRGAQFKTQLGAHNTKHVVRGFAASHLQEGAGAR